MKQPFRDNSQLQIDGKFHVFLKIKNMKRKFTKYSSFGNMKKKKMAE